MSNLMNSILNTLNANNTKVEEKKEDITMTTNTRSATRPSTFTKSQWDKATYAAYMGLIAIVERRATIATFLKDNAGLFMGCGVPADEAHVLSLVIAMAKDTTVDQEKVRKVNPIGSLRQFFNTTWLDKDYLKVSYKAPAQPKEPQPRAPKAKKSPEETVVSLFSKMTDAEKAALVAKLLAA